MPNLSKTSLSNLLASKTPVARLEAMRTVNLGRDQIKEVLTESEKSGTEDLDLTANALLMRSVKGDYEEAYELATWSAKAKPASRKAVVASFIKNKQSPFFVHQIARQKRADAATLMEEYFKEGGDIKDVAEWLSAAGAILKTGVVPNGTDGLWDSIKNAAGSVVDAVVGAINTVADAIAAAGKNLADAIKEVASWTQSKVSDFVEAIIRAGKKVSDILTEAVKKGTAVLHKFIQAVIEAGKKGLEVIEWAVTKAADVLRASLQKLEQLYNSFTTLLIEIAKIAATKLGAIVKELLNMGKSIAEFVSRLERIAYDTAKLIVQEIKKAGRAVRDIMQALANMSRYIARIVMDALRAASVAINDMLKEVLHWTEQQLSVLIGALKDLAVTLGQVLDAVAKFVGAQAVKLMKALREIWKEMKEVLEFIAQKAKNIMHTLLVALLGTVVHIVEVLGSIAADVRAAFREGLIEGLMAIGHGALTLLKEAVKISVSAALVVFGIILDVLGTNRGLTAAERAEAEKVFGTSINLDMVQITDANLATDLIMWINGNRAFTTMYLINYKSGSPMSPALLIHEMTHIWQAVNSGGVYMIEALHSQFFGRGYNLTEQDVINAGGKLLNLEREQQAVLVEEYWKAEFNGQNIPLSLDLIRPLAKQVYKAPGRRLVPVDLRNLAINRITV